MELNQNQAALILEANDEGEISVNLAAHDTEGLAGEICKVIATKLSGDEKFQELIQVYNSGAANAEKTFAELLKLAGQLNDEERRHMREELSEEELTIFDLLTKPEIEMTDKERRQVKNVAHELLETLKKERMVLDWRKKEATRSAVQATIKDILDELPIVYDKELYDLKCDSVYQHVFESYWGRTESVYSGM